MVMVNAVSMDNVEHAYAVQQLRKSGKNAKIVSLTLIILLLLYIIIFWCTCLTLCIHTKPYK